MMMFNEGLSYICLNQDYDIVGFTSSYPNAILPVRNLDPIFFIPDLDIAKIIDYESPESGCYMTAEKIYKTFALNYRFYTKKEIKYKEENDIFTLFDNDLKFSFLPDHILWKDENGTFQYDESFKITSKMRKIYTQASKQCKLALEKTDIRDAFYYASVQISAMPNMVEPYVVKAVLSGGFPLLSDSSYKLYKKFAENICDHETFDCLANNMIRKYPNLFKNSINYD